MVVVCVPGGGGPNLADHLRAAHGPGGLSVHLVVVAGDPPPPLLVGDPMSGVFWPCERRPDDEAPAAEAARRARQCRTITVIAVACATG